MRAPTYAALKLDGVHAGELLEWHNESETYRSIAKFGQAGIAARVADELNAAEARAAHERLLVEQDDAREAAEEALRARGDEILRNGGTLPKHPDADREVQLDALVIPGDTKAHPELHADHRPDSYGQLEEDRRARQEKADHARGIGPRVIGFAGRSGNGYSAGFGGVLPPDGTVPGR